MSKIKLIIFDLDGVLHEKLLVDIRQDNIQEQAEY